MRKLKLLLAALVLTGATAAWGQASYNKTWTEGVEVAEGGDYFLYNIGAGRFLDNGMNWGTRATVDNAGKALTFTAADGAYTIYTGVKTRYNAGGLGDYLGTNGYMDAASAPWTFTPVSVSGYTNVYTISNGENYLVYQTNAEGDNPAVNLTALSGTDNDYWIIITKAQRQAVKDYTFQLDNTCFNRPWENKVWALNISSTGSGGNSSPLQSGGKVDNRCAESYRNAFTYTQKASNLTNGKYVVYNQGFYRNDGGTDPSYLIANNDKSAMALINANGEGTAQNMDGASTSFSKGEYVNSVTTIVTDNTLTLGISNENNMNWVIWSNFYLEYLGPCIGSEAVALPSAGAMEADKWYYFDVTLGGDYELTSSTLSAIVYTKDGSILMADAASVDATFGQAKQTLEEGRYYVKSPSANSLTVNPLSYTYVVGDATSSIPDGSFASTLTTVDFTFSEATTNDNTATFAILNSSAKAILKKGGSEVAQGAFSLSGKVLTATFSDVALEVGGTYTIEVPSGVVGYEGQESNSSISIAINGPTIANGIYYFKRNDADYRYLTRGGNYGTENVTDRFGIAFEAAIQGDGSYTLKNIDQSLADNKTKYLNRQYTDQEAAYKWFIEKTDDGYLLKREGKYVTTTEEPTWHYQYLSDAESSSDAIVWTLLTEEEYAADLAQRKNEEIASVANGFGVSASSEEDFEETLESGYGEADMTNMITNASLQSNADGWTALSYNNQRRNQTGEEGNKVDAIRFNGGAEVWNYIGGAEQTIKDLPAGLYKITVKAVWRIADADPAKRVGDKANVTAWMYANDNYTQLKSWYDHQAANNAALRSSTNDEYVNTVYVYLNGSEDLTIGVASPTWCGTPWMPFYDWKLKKVEEIRYVSDITLNETSASLNLCDELYLNATVAPEDAHNKDVEWSTSDEYVATVDNGKVTAIGQGSVTITATAKDGSGKYASCYVTVNATPSLAVYSEVDEGDFYIRNVATGRYLGGANDWGTRASLIKHGIPFGLKKVSEGVYTFDSYTYNNAENHYLTGTYVDNVLTNIYVVDLGSGKYALSTADGSQYISAAAGSTVVANNAESSDSEWAQWQFISVGDRLANIESIDNDATFLLTEANISRNLRRTYGQSGWVGKFSYGGNDNNQCAEYFHGGDGNNEGVAPHIYQSIAVPNGTYKLRVQGFYRADEGSAEPSYFYANEERQSFIEREEGGPNDMSSASAAFTAGRYWNELTVEVTDNHLTVGIKTDDTKNWTIWDNFELYMTSSGSTNTAEVEGEHFLTPDNGKSYVTIGGRYGSEGVTTTDSQQKFTFSTNSAGIATIKTPKGNLFWDDVENNGIWSDAQRHVQKSFFYPYWAFEESSDGYQIRNIQTGRYLTVSDGKLTLSDEKTAWKLDDVADESDVQSLKEMAVAPTLGFESGEYAPYNNVEALETIAQIQHTDANGMPSLKVERLKSLVNDIDWTANSEDVDAIYDGSFATAPIQATSENVSLKGWVAKSGNLRQTFKGNGEDGQACLADDEVGLFVHPGTYNYGETAGYTMPLKGGQLYVAKAKYCSWNTKGQNHDFALTILKGGETVKSQSYGQNEAPCTEAGSFREVKLYFTPEEDGDYVLSVGVNGNTFMTGFSIIKTEADDITIDEDATEAPAASDYANVTLNRGFKAGWNAVCLPMSVPAFNDCVIVELAGEEGESNAVTLKFRKVDSFVANKPYLVYFPADVAAGKTFEGIAVTPGEVKAEGTTFDFMGTYTVADVVKEGDYVISAGKLSKANQTITLKGTRTYFTPKTAGARLAGFTVDGETTGVSATLVNSEKVKSEQFFDLKGVRVSKPTKGVFIQNGKKVVK